MERADIFELMTRLKLYGMRAAYDEVMTTGIERRHEPARIVGELLSAEIAEKQARSIKYQMTIAKLPLAKEIDDFDFTGTPINQALIRDLAGGDFIVQQRDAVLVGGTRTGKLHLAIAIAGLHPQWHARRFYIVIDVVNRLETEARISHPHGFCRARRARLFALLAGRRATALPPDQPALRTHLDHYHDQSGLWRMAERLR